MSNSKTPVDAASTKLTAEEKLANMLKVAADTAQAEIAGSANKSVSAKATLETSVTENGDTECSGVNAAVSLGISTYSSKDAKVDAKN